MPPFVVYAPALVFEISPRAGPAAGGTIILLRGRGLNPFGDGPSQTSFRFSASDVAGFVVDGVLRRDLTLVRGMTYLFEVEAEGHPLILSRHAGKGWLAGELGEADGVRNSRLERGAMLFTPNAALPALLFYHDFSAPLSLDGLAARQQRIQLVPPRSRCLVRMNGALLQPIEIGDASLVVRAPEGAAGNATVAVSLNGQQFEAQSYYYYHAAPSISRVVPRSAMAMGRVMLFGRHLKLPAESCITPGAGCASLPALVIQNAIIPADAAAADGGSLNFTLPDLPPGVYPIRLTHTGRAADSVATGAEITLNAPIVFSVISPAWPGGASGGSAAGAASGGAAEGAGAPGSSAKERGSPLRPPAGPRGGGTMVVIPTAALPPNLELCCVFGASECVIATVVESPTTGIQCSAPPGSDAGGDGVFVGVFVSLDGGLTRIDTGSRFAYYSAALSYVSPQLGPARGGVALTVHGGSFVVKGLPSAYATCRFTPDTGAPVEAPAASLSASAVVCPAAPSCACSSPVSGCNLTLSVSLNGKDYGGGELQHACYPPLLVETIEPSAGPAAGGTSVVVRSSFFSRLLTSSASASSSSACVFGGVGVLGTIRDGTMACAPSPTLASIGSLAAPRQPLQVMLNGLLEPEAAAAPRYTFYRTPSVHRLEPVGGPVLGGTALTLHGLHLDGEGTASVASARVRLGFGEARQELNVSALGPGGAFLITTVTAPAPAGCAELCCVAEGVGGASGATPCSTGHGADASCSHCVLALEISLNNGVDFERVSHAPPWLFYNDSLLRIDRVQPASGPARGGTRLTFFGVGLAPAGGTGSLARCGFGNVSSAVVAFASNGSWLVCDATPPFAMSGNASGAAGARVRVAANGIDYAPDPSDLSFLVFADPTLTGLVPSSGPTAGGTVVRIHGVQLVAGLLSLAGRASCRFGRRAEGAVVALLAVDADGVTCGASPPEPEYEALGVDQEVQISLNGQQFAPTPGFAFRFYAPPTLAAVAPAGGVARGGTLVTLSGERFDGLAAWSSAHPAVNASGTPFAQLKPTAQPTCVFGGLCFGARDEHRGLGCALDAPLLALGADALATAATVLSATRILCRSPERAVRTEGRGRTSVRVALALNSQNFAHNGAPLFVYYSGVVVSGLQPGSGPPTGGVEVRLSGSNFGIFGEAATARCRFSKWRPTVLAARLVGTSAESADVAAEHKDEGAAVCRTPRGFKAGSVEVAFAINGRDFETASPPLKYIFACEQHASKEGCISAEGSCGFCSDSTPGDAHYAQHGERLPGPPVSLGQHGDQYGLGQTRVGCLGCAASGCAAGPKEGTCRRWEFETRLLRPPASEAEARALELSGATNCNASARATGEVLPGSMAYYRVLASQDVRILVSAKSVRGQLQLFARRRLVPGSVSDQHELHTEAMPSVALVVPQHLMRCRAPAEVHTHAAEGGELHWHASGAGCDEWVFGVLGSMWVPNFGRSPLGEYQPQARASDFEFRVRVEPEVASFECAACGGDCTACNWHAGHATKFVHDHWGASVARLTNETHQLGTLWFAQPQPLEAGFVARFAFRVSEPSYCTLPLAIFGSSNLADHLLAERTFAPMTELRDVGLATTNWLADHHSLPFAPLDPPEGVPVELAGAAGLAGDPTVRFGEFSELLYSRLRAPFEPALPGRVGDRVGDPGRQFACGAANPRVGGDGLAFVVQWEGPGAAGCSGTGVGYARGRGPAECPRSISRSVAVQLDVNHNLRVERQSTCRQRDPLTGGCAHYEHKDKLMRDRRNAVGIFRDGDNGVGAELGIKLLGGYDGVRFDDGEVHGVTVTYTPGRPAGVLAVHLDDDPSPALAVPFSLPRNLGEAYVGFTAGTGFASERHDIHSFSFCQRPGCAVV